MATIIDTLIVTLGLDTDKFVAGQKNAQDALKKTREEATKHAKELSSEIGEKLTSSFEKATARVLEFMAALAGARSLESFVSQTVAAGNALNLMATALGMTPRRLSEFESAVERSGGKADAAAESLKKLNDIRIATKDESRPPPDWIQRLGVNLRAATNGEDVLKQLVDNAKSLNKSSQDFIYEAGTLGIDPFTAKWAYENGSSGGIDKSIDAQSTVAWTDAQVASAERLRTAWMDASQSVTAMARAILPDVETALIKLIGWIDELIKKSGPGLQGWIGDKIKEFAEAMQSTDWKAIGKSLDGYLDKIKQIVDALGGWENLATYFLELWVGFKAFKAISVITRLAVAIGKLSGAGSLLAGAGWLAKVAVGGMAAIASLPAMIGPNAWDGPDGVKNAIKQDDAERAKFWSFWKWAYGKLNGDGLTDTTGGYASGENAGLFSNMKGRGLPREVSENNPLPVKIMQGVPGSGIPGSSAPDAAGLPSYPAGEPQDTSGGGGTWNKVKKWLGFGGVSGTLPVTGSTADIAAGLKAAMPHLTTGECVELAQVMNGVGNVHDWRRGASVQQTRPPIGTAVSTFGYNGESKLYANGGSGTRGIGRDHAGIIAGYDDNGFTMLNQWHGQSPTYTYYPYGGSGEHGGQNYFVINGPDDLPAGKNAKLLSPHINSAPNVPSGAKVGTHRYEHERLSMAGGKTSVQIGALHFGSSSSSGNSSYVEEQMRANLFISRADYGLA